MHVSNMSCRAFAQTLAARVSNPGGGSAAALAGALGCALAAMSAGFTCGKPAYTQHETRLAILITQADELREHLLELIDNDAHHLKILMETYQLPKSDPARSQRLQTALTQAMQSPFAMMHDICRAIDILDELESICTPMLLSDVASGALLCRAALEAAWYNVIVNTRLFHDKAYAQSIEDECETMMRTYVPRSEDVAARVRAYMKGSS